MDENGNNIALGILNYRLQNAIKEARENLMLARNMLDAIDDEIATLEAISGMIMKHHKVVPVQ